MDINKMKKKGSMVDVGEIKKRYSELKKQINVHNKLYYDENNPKITDFEYDKL